MKRQPYFLSVILALTAFSNASYAANLNGPNHESETLTQPEYLSAEPINNNVLLAQAAASQVKRIYISPTGNMQGTRIDIPGAILYVNSSGAMTISDRDYTADLSERYVGDQYRVSQIGSTRIRYRYTGDRYRISQIGDTHIRYRYTGDRYRISQIGDTRINYRYSSDRYRISRIGDIDIRYNRNSIRTISSNYTGDGIQVVVSE